MHRLISRSNATAPAATFFRVVGAAMLAEGVGTGSNWIGFGLESNRMKTPAPISEKSNPGYDTNSTFDTNSFYIFSYLYVTGAIGISSTSGMISPSSEAPDLAVAPHLRILISPYTQSTRLASSLIVLMY
jgi:hypothetical protein